MRRKRFPWVALLAAPPLLFAAEKNIPLPVELYVMSLCPYGVQAENTLIPAVQALGKNVRLEMHFIADEVPGSSSAPFRALHGQPEVDENIRQLCALHLFPDKAFGYILERNKNYRAPDWEPAARASGISPASLAACAGGAKGRDLLKADIPRHKERQAAGSPTLYINGEKYQGARGKKAFAQALCASLAARDGRAPSVCGEVVRWPDDATAPGGSAGCGAPAAAPAPVKLDIVAVTSAECPSCRPALSGSLATAFSGASTRTVEASSAEGRSLMAAAAMESLPVYWIRGAVEDHPGFLSLKGFLQRAPGGFYVVPGPGTYTPTFHPGRLRVKGRVDFIASPLSAEGYAAQRTLLGRLLRSGRKDLSFRIHPLLFEPVSPATGTPAGLMAVNGPEEVQESLRQACLLQRGSLETFLTYLDCRRPKPEDPVWARQCFTPDGPAAACFSGREGEALLREAARLARAWDVSAGPVLIWENRQGPFPFNDLEWDSWMEKKR